MFLVDLIITLVGNKTSFFQTSIDSDLYQSIPTQHSFNYIKSFPKKIWKRLEQFPELHLKSQNFSNVNRLDRILRHMELNLLNLLKYPRSQVSQSMLIR